MDIDINLSNLKEIPTSMQIVIILVACILFFLLGYFFDISSLKKSLVTAQQSEADLKIQIEASYGNHASMYKEIAKLPKLKQMLADWQGKLIKSSDLPDLLNEILKVGISNQLRFKLFTPAPELKEGPYLKVPIKTEIIGKYHQIASFFNELANMQSIVVISDFTLLRNTNAEAAPKDVSSNTSNESLLNALLTLEVYYLPEKS